MSSLLGRKAPHLSKRDKAGLARKLNRFIRSAKPYLLALGTISGRIEPTTGRYALLEGLLKEQLRLNGKRIRDDQDAFDLHVQLAGRLAAPSKAGWAQTKCYRSGWSAIEVFAKDLGLRLDPRQLQELLSEWSDSSDAQQDIQFARHAPTALRRFRQRAPKRLTDKLVLQLMDEYRTAAAIFERRLRLFLYFMCASHNAPEPWSYWAGQRLNNLMQIASSYSQLTALLAALDRNVRNALAHGEPVVDVNTGICRFSDGTKELSWTFHEFYERTRCLTLHVMALYAFEPLLQLVQAERLAHDLWAGVHAAGNRDAG